jgi:hypothetical protein
MCCRAPQSSDLADDVNLAVLELPEHLPDQTFGVPVALGICGVHEGRTPFECPAKAPDGLTVIGIRRE